MGSRMEATPQGALQVMQWSQRGQFMVVGREARSPGGEEWRCSSSEKEEEGERAGVSQRGLARRCSNTVTSTVVQ
jgi:hypothetical protein